MVEHGRRFSGEGRMRADVLQTRRKQAVLRAAGPLALAWLLGACGAAPVPEVPPADPAAAEGPGLSWLSRKAIDGYLDFRAWTGSRSGFIAMFARDGRVVHATSAGHADLESGRPMRLDTPVRIASMTKPVTAVAAMVLVQEGRLRLDDPVARYLPAAEKLRVATSSDGDENGTIPTASLGTPLLVRHLLMFSSGIGNGGDGEDPTELEQLWSDKGIDVGAGSLAERVDRVLTLPLYEEPGTRWRYGWSADVLARVVEIASGEPFDAFLEQRIFQPLGMSSTFFPLHGTDLSELARVYTQDEDGELVLVETGTTDWTSGGGGLVSTAGDYMRFALMLWNGGRYDGVQILEPGTLEEMIRPHVPSGVLGEEGIEGQGWGLGLAVVVDAEATPTADRDGDFWWAGYYGTTFIVSPETGLVAVVISQNEPGPHSDLPIDVYVAQAMAYLGL
jgi:CubicO group peptidase (beta-lactamase class C family)